MMGPEKDLKEMSSFPHILTEGGDDRLPLHPKTGVNKYFSKPEVATGSAFRGSCTCNSPSVEGYAAAEEMYNHLKNNKLSTEQAMHNIREQLRKAYKLSDNTGVFLTPSGSDAEYIPLLIAKILNPGKKVLNIVTCHEEVGSGTLDASKGQYFSTMEPIDGGLMWSNNIQMISMSDKIDDLADDVQVIPIYAREPNGEVLDAKPEIENAL